MKSGDLRLRFQTVSALALMFVAGIVWTTRFVLAQPAEVKPVALESSFEQTARPFLKQRCMLCHNTDTAMSGVRVDQLDASLEDRHLKLWEAIRRKVSDGTMPP